MLRPGSKNKGAQGVVALSDRGRIVLSLLSNTFVEIVSFAFKRGGRLRLVVLNNRLLLLRFLWLVLSMFQFFRLFFFLLIFRSSNYLVCCLWNRTLRVYIVLYHTVCIFFFLESWTVNIKMKPTLIIKWIIAILVRYFSIYLLQFL